MKEVIYLDVYFGLNFLMDWVMLAVSSLAAGESLKKWRALAGALFGGAVSCLLLFVFSKGLRLFFGAIALVLMHWIAFGRRTPRRFASLVCFSLLASLFLGGAVEALGYYTAAGGAKTRVTLGAFFFCAFAAFGGYTLWGRKMKRRLQSTVVDISVRFRGQQEEVCALVDSGSFLSDPDSGDPVLILKASFAGRLFSPAELEAIRKGTDGETAPFRIPFVTASGRGDLVAFRPDSIRIYGIASTRKVLEVNSVLIALDFSGGGFAGCPCLVPLSVI